MQQFAQLAAVTGNEYLVGTDLSDKHQFTPIATF
jgi:hypothetical protein